MAIISPLVGQPYDDVQFRRGNSASPEGIVRDEDGSSFRATTNISTSTVTLSAGEAIIQGFDFFETGTTSLVLSNFGTVPANGQSRSDIIVLQYDPAQQSAPARLTVKPGTPAGTGATVTRSRAGVWEIPLWNVTYAKNAAGSVSIIVTDRRAWTGPTFVQPDTLSAAGAASPFAWSGPNYLGTTVMQGEQRWHRVLKGGAPTWQTTLQTFPKRYAGTLTGPWSNPVNDNNFRQLGRLAIPDPGYAYFIRLDAQCVAYMTPGNSDGRVDVSALVGGSDLGTGTSAGNGGGDLLASTDGRFGGDLHHLNGMSARTYTGTQTIYLRGLKPYGTGSWVSATTAFIMTAEIVRAA